MMNLKFRQALRTIVTAMILGSGVMATATQAATTSKSVTDAAVETRESDPLAMSEVLVSRGYDPASINLEARRADSDGHQDEVILADGDVIRGSITSETDEEVVLMHPVFKEMRIPRDHIVAIRRDAQNRSAPGFGEVITGAGVRPPNSSMPPAGRKGMTADGVEPRGTTTEGEDPAGEAEAGDPIEELTDESNWTFVFGTAFGYVQNINNEINLRLSAQAEHTSNYARLRIDSAYFLNSTNDDVVDNDFRINTTQDWFIPSSDLSIFVQGSYQWDAFEIWEHRLSGYLGPGYSLIDDVDLTIDLRLGGGASYEYSTAMTLPEALVAVEWSWNIDERQKINGTCSYIPDVTRLEQYRLQLNGEWNFRLQKEEGLSFYVGIRDEFQSIVPEESTNNDLRVFGGIKYEF